MEKKYGSLSRYYDVVVPLEWALEYADTDTERKELINSSENEKVVLHFLMQADSGGTIITNGCHFGIKIKN